MSKRECINFDISPDDEDEEEEEFQLILTSELQGVQNSTSIVVITDSKFLYITEIVYYVLYILFISLNDSTLPDYLSKCDVPIILRTSYVHIPIYI